MPTARANTGAALALSAALLGGAAAPFQLQAQAQVQAQAPESGGDANAVELGRSLYFRGARPDGGAVRAYVGAAATPAPAALFPCVNCHGEDGTGVAEGGIAPADIRWETLTKPYGRPRLDGGVGAPYDRDAFAKALSEGVDPDGRRLGRAMPRYVLAEDGIEALWETLRHLAQAADPGVGVRAVRLGTILPLTGPSAELGRAVREFLEAAMAEFNAGGSVHGRRLELAVADGGDLSRPAEELLAELARDGGVFALTAPVLIGRERAVLDAARRAGLPILAPVTAVESGARAGDRVFTLTAGVEQQALRLLESARAEMADRPLLVLTDQSSAAASVAERIVDSQAARSPRAPVIVSPGQATAPPNRPAVYLLLGRPEDHTRALAAAPAGSLILAPAEIADPRGLAALQPNARIRVSFPSLAGDFPDALAGRFSKVFGAAGLGRRDLPAATRAFSALELTIEGLKRAGRLATRRRFVEGLEQLRDFHRTLGPPLTFGPNRHAGSTGAHLLEFDPGASEPNGPAKWVEPDEGG